MLTYQDCLELKEAGFPKDWTDLEEHDGDLLQKKESWDMYGLGYSPTLSELIGACGGEFKGLLIGTPINERFQKKYITVYKIGFIEKRSETSTPYFNCEWNDWDVNGGDTPEQAVKNHWIALNKK